MMTPSQIARVCHEANRAYCETIGDNSQVSWAMAADWQKTSAVAGVQYRMENPDASPADQHEKWLEDKIGSGWTWGPVKDPAKKEHPCCVPYDQLPEEQKVKDTLFSAVVTSFLPRS